MLRLQTINKNKAAQFDTQSPAFPDICGTCVGAPARVLGYLKLPPSNDRILLQGRSCQLQQQDNCRHRPSSDHQPRRHELTRFYQPHDKGHHQ